MGYEDDGPSGYMAPGAVAWKARAEKLEASVLRLRAEVERKDARLSIAAQDSRELQHKWESAVEEADGLAENLEEARAELDRLRSAIRHATNNAVAIADEAVEAVKAHARRTRQAVVPYATMALTREDGEE